MGETITVSASQVGKAIKELAEGDDEADAEGATPTRVGRILSRLRPQKDRTGDEKRDRMRTATKDEVQGLARAVRLAPDLEAVPSRMQHRPCRAAERR